jgi:hypothetical protein
LKTANPIERINKELKRRTKSMETLGESTLTAVVAFTALKLGMGGRCIRLMISGMRSFIAFGKQT